VSRRCALLLLGMLGCAGSQKSPATSVATAAPPALPPAPAAAEPPPVPAPAYMEQPPTLPPVRAFVPPAPASWKLKNGLTVTLLEKHTAPLVGVSLVVPTGSDADPPSKAGLAALTANLLDEGAGGRGTLEIAEAIEQLGAQLQTAASVESSQVVLEVLRPRLEPALGLLADVALRPNFDAKEFDRIKAETLAHILQRKSEPHAVAALVLDAALYGKTAYGRPVEGTVKSVEPIVLSDVRAFYAAHYHPGGAILVVSGDVTMDELRPQVERLFGAWKPGPIRKLLPPKPPRTRPRLVLVDKPGAPQSVVRVGEPTLARRSPDYPALETAIMVLGGSFTSRLERNLRERNNFSYGASARIEWRRGAGPLVLGADVFSDVTAPALAELLKELAGIRDGVSEEELGKAKALERQQLVHEMQSGFGLTQLLSALVTAGLPPGEYRNLEAQLERLQDAQLKQAADRYVHPDRATIVIVGDLAKIRPAIEKLGSFAIEVWDADGNRL